MRLFPLAFLTACGLDSTTTKKVGSSFWLEVPTIEGIDVFGEADHTGIMVPLACDVESESCTDEDPRCNFDEELWPDNEAGTTPLATLYDAAPGVLRCKTGDPVFPDGSYDWINGFSGQLMILPELTCTLASDVLTDGFVEKGTTVPADSFRCDCSSDGTPMGEAELTKLSTFGSAEISEDGDLVVVGEDPFDLDYECKAGTYGTWDGTETLAVAADPVITLNVQPQSITRGSEAPKVTALVESLADQTELHCEIAGVQQEVVTLDTSPGDSEHTFPLSEVVLGTPVDSEFPIVCTAVINEFGGRSHQDDELVYVGPLDVWGTCIEPATLATALELDPLSDMVLGITFRVVLKADPYYSGPLLVVESEYQYITLDIVGNVVTLTVRGRQADGSNTTITLTASLSSDHHQELRFTIDLTGNYLAVDGEELHYSDIPLSLDTLEGLPWTFYGVTETEVASILMERGRLEDEDLRPFADPCQLDRDGNCWDFSNADSDRIEDGQVIEGRSGETATAIGTWAVDACE